MIKRITLKNASGDKFNVFEGSPEECATFIDREFTSGIHGQGVTKEELDVTDEAKDKSSLEKRKKEYPTLAEFFDVYADGTAQEISDFKDRLKAIKVKNPKKVKP